MNWTLPCITSNINKHICRQEYIAFLCSAAVMMFIAAYSSTLFSYSFFCVQALLWTTQCKCWRTAVKPLHLRFAYQSLENSNNGKFNGEMHLKYHFYSNHGIWFYISATITKSQGTVKFSENRSRCLPENQRMPTLIENITITQLHL